METTSCKLNQLSPTHGDKYAEAFRLEHILLEFSTYLARIKKQDIYYGLAILPFSECGRIN